MKDDVVKSLSENILHAIDAMDGVKRGIEYHNIEVPNHTNVLLYEELIKSIRSDSNAPQVLNRIITEILMLSDIVGINEKDTRITEELHLNDSVSARHRVPVCINTIIKLLHLSDKAFIPEFVGSIEGLNLSDSLDNPITIRPKKKILEDNLILRDICEVFIEAPA